MKNVLKVLLVFMSLGLVLMAIGWIRLNQHITWGHHFTFENQLGLPIDSLCITIGDELNWVYPEDSVISGNLTVPTQGYPHQVGIIMYSQDTTFGLAAESFDCYQCDGYHYYVLTPSGAEYYFY